MYGASIVITLIENDKGNDIFGLPLQGVWVKSKNLLYFAPGPVGEPSPAKTFDLLLRIIPQSRHRARLIA
jgi:hypothetical protein